MKKRSGLSSSSGGSRSPPPASDLARPSPAAAHHHREEQGEAPPSMKKRHGLSSSSGGSRSPPPAADLAHPSPAAADHQDSSEELMTTIEATTNLGRRCNKRRHCIIDTQNEKRKHCIKKNREEQEAPPSMTKRPDLCSSSSGRSCSPPPAADLPHSSPAAADHQDSSEELMVITIKNQLSPATEAYRLPTSITVGALKDLLRPQVPLRDFLLLQECEDGCPSALFHETASLANCHVTHGDTLHLTSPDTFPLGLYDNSPVDLLSRNCANNPVVKGRFIHLQPSVYYTVAHLKEIIFRITGYHPEHQLLNPLTTMLHEMDNRTLQSLGFKSSDRYRQLTLYNCPPPPPNQLLPPSPPKIHISVVETSFGGKCTISVDPNVTVKELRSDIIEVGETSCFRFGSTVLENDKTLSDYNITNGDIILLSESR